jgi:hypothetical protein
VREIFQEIGNKDPGFFVPLSPMSQERGGFCWHCYESVQRATGESYETAGLEGLAYSQTVVDTLSTAKVES